MLPFILLTFKNVILDLFIYFLRYSLTVYSWLTWNLLWKPLWPQIQRPACLLIAEINGIQPPCLADLLNFVPRFCALFLWYCLFYLYLLSYKIHIYFVQIHIFWYLYQILQNFICMSCYFSNVASLLRPLSYFSPSWPFI